MKLLLLLLALTLTACGQTGKLYHPDKPVNIWVADDDSLSS